jgi:hypothetical protein
MAGILEEVKPPRPDKSGGFLSRKRRNPPKPPLHAAVGPRNPPFLVRPKGQGLRAKAGDYGGAMARI